jgi:GT2 family glycosyltransferase
MTARTAILVLNHNGLEHLDDCLASLAALDVFAAGGGAKPVDPPARDEVWLLDNGSTDGSAGRVLRDYPWVHLERYAGNLGFSVAYNRAVEACDAEHVVFLNNDARVAPDWLTELHECRQRHPGAAAVASRIMSWDGETTDFTGADTFFFGQALQHGVGRPAAVSGFPERRLLFGCAGALLFRRRDFLELGGFDPDYFSFSEDVDLGWRASAWGRETWFAPAALAFHKLHGSWSRQPSVRARTLLERNALCNVLKNYDGDRYGVFLLASVVLALLRAWAWTSGLAEARRPFLSSDGVAHLVALRDLVALAPAMRARRHAVQEGRHLSDDQLLPLFGAFAEPPLPPCPGYRDLFAATRAALRLEAGTPLPAWSRAMNAEAEAAALVFAERCGATLSGWTAAERFTEEAPEPNWHYVLGADRGQALGELRAASIELIESGLDEAAVRTFGSALGSGCGSLPAAAARARRGIRRRTAGAFDAPPLARPRPDKPSVPASSSVSLIVRTQDRPELLRRALRTIVGQTLLPLEVVVVNDGGTDPGHILETIDALPVKLVSLPARCGRSHAAQAGLEAARGELVGFLDDDDELRPRHCEALAEGIARSGAQVAYADVECVVVDTAADGTEHVVQRSVLGGEPDPARLFFENTVPIMAVLMNRRLALEAGGFDPDMEYFEDWDLWLRLSRLTSFCHVPEVTSTYYVRTGGGFAGRHRYPYLARILDRHKPFLHGADWARFYETQLEPLREHARDLEAQVAALRAQLDAVQGSKYWRTYQWLRRLLGRA